MIIREYKTYTVDIDESTYNRLKELEAVWKKSKEDILYEVVKELHQNDVVIHMEDKGHISMED